MALINKDNLNESSLTNAEVIALLEKLALQLDPSGFSRTLDVIEDLTGNRSFTEFAEAKIDDAKNSLALKVTKAALL